MYRAASSNNVIGTKSDERGSAIVYFGFGEKNLAVVRLKSLTRHQEYDQIIKKGNMATCNWTDGKQYSSLVLHIDHRKTSAELEEVEFNPRFPFYKKQAPLEFHKWKTQRQNELQKQHRQQAKQTKKKLSTPAAKKAARASAYMTASTRKKKILDVECDSDEDEEQYSTAKPALATKTALAKTGAPVNDDSEDEEGDGEEHSGLEDLEDSEQEDQERKQQLRYPPNFGMAFNSAAKRPEAASSSRALSPDARKRRPDQRTPMPAAQLTPATSGTKKNTGSSTTTKDSKGGGSKLPTRQTKDQAKGGPALPPALPSPKRLKTTPSCSNSTQSPIMTEGERLYASLRAATIVTDDMVDEIHRQNMMRLMTDPELRKEIRSTLDVPSIYDVEMDYATNFQHNMLRSDHTALRDRQKALESEADATLNKATQWGDNVDHLYFEVLDFHARLAVMDKNVIDLQDPVIQAMVGFNDKQTNKMIAAGMDKTFEPDELVNCVATEVGATRGTFRDEPLDPTKKTGLYIKMVKVCKHNGWTIVDREDFSKTVKRRMDTLKEKAKDDAGKPVKDDVGLKTKEGPGKLTATLSSEGGNDPEGWKKTADEAEADLDRRGKQTQATRSGMDKEGGESSSSAKYLGGGKVYGTDTEEDDGELVQPSGERKRKSYPE